MGFLDKKKEEVKQEVKVEKAEETKEVKKEEAKHKFMVVKELPVQAIREQVDEDGTIIHFVTAEEALTEFMNQ